MIDDARSQDEGGTGLGLAIALDIARSHGGDITLGDSKAGGYGQRCGCRCTLKLISQRFEQDEEKIGNRLSSSRSKLLKSTMANLDRFNPKSARSMCERVAA